MVSFFTINQWFDESFFNENAMQNLHFPSINLKKSCIGILVSEAISANRLCIRGVTLTPTEFLSSKKYFQNFLNGRFVFSAVTLAFSINLLPLFIFTTFDLS